MADIRDDGKGLLQHLGDVWHDDLNTFSTFF